MNLKCCYCCCFDFVWSFIGDGLGRLFLVLEDPFVEVLPIFFLVLLLPPAFAFALAVAIAASPYGSRSSEHFQH